MTQLPLLVEAFVGIGILAAFRMVRSDRFVSAADLSPVVRIEELDILGDKVEFAARDCLEPQFDLLGGDYASYLVREPL